GRAEALDRWWRQRKCEGVADLHELAVDPRGDSLSRIFRAALAPILERYECQRGVLPGTREAEAGDCKHAVDAFLGEESVLDLLDDLQRSIRARLWRGLNVDDQVSLVLVRQKRCGQSDVRPSKTDKQREINDHEPAGSAHDGAD